MPPECGVGPGEARAVHVAAFPDRHAQLIVPDRAPVKGLAVDLHGSGFDVERHQAVTRLAGALLRYGIAVLLPQAAIPFQLMPQLAAGYAWNIPGAPLPGHEDVVVTAIDDIAWLKALVWSQLMELALPEGPLLLCGYSGGARLASHLLVKADLPWRAAALVAGLRAVDDGRVPPPPTLAFHGRDDPINAYAGGQGLRWTMGVEEAAHLHALAQGSTRISIDERAPNAQRRIYRTAQGKPTLTLCTLETGAHAWPGSADREHLRLFGPIAGGVDATAEIAAFFAAHLDS